MLESYDVLINIMAALKRLACFYLFTTEQMNQLCIALDKCFHIFYEIRNKFKKSDRDLRRLNEKESKLLITIIKTLTWVAYCYNDNIVRKALNNKDLYDDINFENTKFLHDKTDIGRNILFCNFILVDSLYKK